MNTHGADNNRQPARLPYASPSLVQYGGVIELTASGSRGDPENNGTQTSKKG